MSFFKQWRFWLSLLLAGFCFNFIQPNFDNTDSNFKINFGLDIQGGFSYLLEGINYFAAISATIPLATLTFTLSAISTERVPSSFT